MRGFDATLANVVTCADMAKAIDTLKAFAVGLALCAAPCARAALPSHLESVMEQTLRPFRELAAAASNQPTDAAPKAQETGLEGKVLCGYQGWFTTEGDGSQRPWQHWTIKAGLLVDGNAKIDLWPDVADLPALERYSTGFKLASGETAEVFSSQNAGTVHRHFAWMREAGIDGALVQRFASELPDPRALRDRNVVLGHCRDGARAQGRLYGVMYDLTGLSSKGMDLLMEDWRALKARLQPQADPAYVKHGGKPLVAVWGVGFSDSRAYSLEDCRRFIEFLKTDPDAGGCAVMLGLPYHWRTLNGDAAGDPALLETVAAADVVNPWTIGRYQSPEQVLRHEKAVLEPDLDWCRQRGVKYVPTVFPGFSWHNMHGGPLDAIPRRKGAFLWSQMLAAKRAGASTLYVAMFDEVDEGTAIFKCLSRVPEGTVSKFVGFEDLPPDFYLRLTGMGGKLLRNEIAPQEDPPRF
jgi:hypothetical protein